MRFDLTSKKIPLTACGNRKKRATSALGDLGNSLSILQYSISPMMVGAYPHTAIVSIKIKLYLDFSIYVSYDPKMSNREFLRGSYETSG